MTSQTDSSIDNHVPGPQPTSPSFPNTTNPYNPTMSYDKVSGDDIQRVVSQFNESNVIEVVNALRVMSQTDPQKTRIYLSQNPQLAFAIAYMLYQPLGAITKPEFDRLVHPRIGQIPQQPLSPSVPVRFVYHVPQQIAQIPVPAVPVPHREVFIPLPAVQTMPVPVQIPPRF